MPVHRQRVILQFKAEPLGDSALAILDARLHELLNPTAIQAHDVIVVFPQIQLENGHAVLEMLASHESRGFKLGQDAINSRESNVLMLLEKLSIDVLGAQVAHAAARQNVENPHSGNGRFEAGTAQVAAFQSSLRGDSLGGKCRVDYPLGPIRSPVRSRRVNMSQLIQSFRLSLGVLALGMLTLAAGCVYRMNIQQGNFLKPEDVDRVQTGMTRSQVRFILGTPLVADSFDGDRWDYYYSFVKGHSSNKEIRHVVVRFDGDKVAQVERLKMPAASLLQPAPEPAAPADPSRLPDVPRT